MLRLLVPKLAIAPCVVRPAWPSCGRRLGSSRPTPKSSSRMWLTPSSGRSRRRPRCQFEEPPIIVEIAHLDALRRRHTDRRTRRARAGSHAQHGIARAWLSLWLPGKITSHTHAFVCALLRLCAVRGNPCAIRARAIPRDNECERQRRVHPHGACIRE